MKDVKIPKRKLEIVQTDDGRRIEHWIKVGEIEDSFEDDQELEFLENEMQDEMFVGVIHLLSPMGPKEIKFEIPADNVDDAFGKYKEYAQITFADLRKQAEEQAKAAEQEAIEQQQRKASEIVVPGAGFDINSIKQ